ncbi:hypothetical protein PsorP6_013289 [Peronosclerospora sorghi]|uniref:Uncharacterized protein n=1 Tax=Peronosclerospora sorghi TaxID=230839 RepID=A0ACC0WGI2_9STRA|nr:hypothetical protein PsorP6_013289 [Peronosclerospora sorghi]
MPAGVDALARDGGRGGGDTCGRRQDTRSRRIDMGRGHWIVDSSIHCPVRQTFRLLQDGGDPVAKLLRQDKVQRTLSRKRSFVVEIPWIERKRRRRRGNGGKVVARGVESGETERSEESAKIGPRVIRDRSESVIEGEDEEIESRRMRDGVENNCDNLSRIVPWSRIAK